MTNISPEDISYVAIEKALENKEKELARLDALKKEVAELQDVMKTMRFIYDLTRKQKNPGLLVPQVKQDYDFCINHFELALCLGVDKITGSTRYASDTSREFYASQMEKEWHIRIARMRIFMDEFVSDEARNHNARRAAHLKTFSRKVAKESVLV